MLLDRFDLAALPFPFAAAAPEGRRPALALSGRAFNDRHGRTVFAMVTSAATVPWPSDLAIVDLETAGLPAPSVVRFKLFTLDNERVAARLGALAKKDAKAVRRALDAVLGEDAR